MANKDNMKNEKLQKNIVRGVCFFLAGLMVIGAVASIVMLVF